MHLYSEYCNKGKIVYVVNVLTSLAKSKQFFNLKHEINRI